jgi:hypothetical protein
MDVEKKQTKVANNTGLFFNNKGGLGIFKGKSRNSKQFLSLFENLANRLFPNSLK